MEIMDETAGKYRNYLFLINFFIVPQGSTQHRRMTISASFCDVNAKSRNYPPSAYFFPIKRLLMTPPANRHAALVKNTAA